jgi:polyisoprenoid-binding protein YceI
MKKIGILVTAVVFLTMSFVSQVKKKLKVDIKNSTIEWKGFKPTGSHNGTINLASGSLVLEGATLIGGSFSVDMSTIEDSEDNKRLEGHLRSEDFFEIEKYAFSKFEITNCNTNDGKSFITGNMTIKDVTKEISFEGTISQTDSTVTLKSEMFQINRADFNVKFKSKTFFNDLKEKYINDEFDMQVIIVAQK